ncbi:cupredoxin domain-containing protein [Streptomyces sp. ISL-100]|uniref:cupredoxin domain-containing protein n=1 Tax=Streptomyces sp. ISL-100 TaxID=2819173 RepID=UPI001BEC5E73|nr:cupredoxin domain-containing protein [Streptomyces sp. ISL-100]MBT2399785.1 cupredoxin domain-containing protein [Streptomyces sp. ISL-100]
MNPQHALDTCAPRSGSVPLDIRNSLKTGARLFAAALTASVLAACGSGEEKQVSVEATDTACTVSPNKASAGTRVTFTVKNTGTKPVDFALVAADGDTVVEEQGIAQGASEETVQSQLNDGGTYTATCTPRGESPIRTEFTVTK